MICKKCGKGNVEWISGIKYEGLDIHHNPPEFMFKDCSDSYAGTHFVLQWTGETYYLCRECHTGKTGIHQTIIIPYLFKESGLLRMNKSEHWLWINIPNSKKQKCREDIFILSKKWVENNGDTKTT
jgi:hypothetical protein